MTIYLSLLVALAGLLVYALFDGKKSEAGRVAYFAGLLAFLLQSAPKIVDALR
jgi:hypothetical protein